MITRRSLLSSAAGAPLAAAAPPAASPQKPWHQRVRRVGQVNFSEKDVAEADVAGWADYWASLKVDAVQINVTGMIAFYPTKVPFHRVSRFLNGRDFFGECCRAAKARGIRVIGRFSPDLQWEEALQAHPEWFLRDREGRPVPPFSRTPGLFQTCMFSTYYTEQTPAVMREVNSLYPVDALYANGWPNWNMPVCFCDVCRKLPPPGSAAYRERFMERAIELWRLFDGIAKEKSPDNIFFGNLGGGYRTGLDLLRLARHCEWFNADNQGRSGASPAWGASQQGRVAQAVMKGRTITNVTGAWSTGSPMWRNATKSPEEATLWMAQTAASGMAIWYHWLGAQTGLGEDRRWQRAGRDFLTWHARHNRHFMNVRSIANIGIVLDQRTQIGYRHPGEGDAGESVQGYYSALLEGRHTFDFIHEDDLTPESAGRYAALILPNSALLSDAQARQIEAYAAAGGAVLGEFETGLYDASGKPRSEFALSRLFGISKTGGRTGARGFENSFYARIERRHEVLRGFSDTNWTAGAEWRVPVRAAEPPVLSVVPSYPAYPTEATYTTVTRTQDAALSLKEEGASRRAYFAGDMGRTFWRAGHPDTLRLINNTLDWLLQGRRPVRVEGEGLIEIFAWETEAGFAVHLINLNNPNLHRGVMLRNSPIGPQAVTLELPRDVKIRQVTALRAEQPVRFQQQGRTVRFTIPRVVEYEVAALE